MLTFIFSAIVIGSVVAAFVRGWVAWNSEAFNADLEKLKGLFKKS